MVVSRASLLARCSAYMSAHANSFPYLWASSRATVQSLFSCSASWFARPAGGTLASIGGAVKFDGVTGVFAVAELASLICRSR